MQPSKLISILTQADIFEESFLRDHGIPKHEALQCLSQHYGLPFVEYDEKRVIPETLLRKLPLDQLKRDLWFPLSCRNGAAAVMIWKPGDRELIRTIRDLLGLDSLHLFVALPFDILAAIAHHQDLSPGFPVSAGRTALARLRTWFAAQRETLSRYRTLLAKGRTGLAFIRTGISFVSISLVLLRIFGFGYLSLAEALLFGSGLVMIYDGFLWYLPIRHLGRKTMEVLEPEPTFGTTVLEQGQSASGISYRRSDPIPGASEMRDRWNRLSPVQRRRFLAIDRTDLAEERTALAGYRTIMAQTRTGLAFTRTGIAFSGLGIALLRQYHTGWWTILDGTLIFCGLLMTAEGFQYYLPGRRIIKYTSIGISNTSNLNKLRPRNRCMLRYPLRSPPFLPRFPGNDALLRQNSGFNRHWLPFDRKNWPLFSPEVTYAELYDDLSREERIEYMRKVEEETERIRDIVKNLLDFSKPKKPNRVEASINAVIQKSLSLVQNMLQISNIDIDVHLAENLPQVLIDINQIQEALINLITNAIQVSSAGDKLRIQSGLDDTGEYVHIAVQDTGRGIPPEFLPHVFDPFFTTKEAGGTGLGLFVSYGIIQNHQGTIQVQSEMGSGTCFTIRLPVCRREETG